MALKANQTDTIATAGGIDTDDTSFALTTGAFDTKSSGDKVPLVIDYDNSAKLEVIKAYVNGTAVTSAVRAQDGTAAVAHSAGAKVCIGSAPSIIEYFIKNDITAGAIPTAKIAAEAWTAHTATLTGFSGTPTQANRYIQIGKIVILAYNISGSSNQTYFTMTLPVAAKSTLSCPGMRTVIDGTATTTPGLVGTTAASATANVYKDHQGNAWTASGTKSSEGTIIYEAA